MDTWINAVKAPFIDVSTLPAPNRPTHKQVALTWSLLGFLIARVL